MHRQARRSRAQLTSSSMAGPGYLRPAGDPGSSAMSDNAPSAKLAIGVFDGMAELCAPVSTLLDLGVRLDQLGIIATRSTLSTTDRPMHVDRQGWSHILHLMADAVPVGECPSSSPIFAGRNISELAGSMTWLCPPQRPFRSKQPDESVKALLRRGFPALAVALGSSEQQRRCLRVLLESSHFPVEAHAFAIRQ